MHHLYSRQRLCLEGCKSDNKYDGCTEISGNLAFNNFASTLQEAEVVPRGLQERQEV